MGGRGATLTDVDGKSYVDYICGLGAQLFGYSDELIREAVMHQLGRGTVYSLSSSLEVEIAENFQSQFHYLERIRFLKTASEACSAAVRIARSFTGKKYVFSHGYNGWHTAHGDELCTVFASAIAYADD